MAVAPDNSTITFHLRTIHKNLVKQVSGYSPGGNITSYVYSLIKADLLERGLIDPATQLPVDNVQQKLASQDFLW